MWEKVDFFEIITGAHQGCALPPYDIQQYDGLSYSLPALEELYKSIQRILARISNTPMM